MEQNVKISWNNLPALSPVYTQYTPVFTFFNYKFSRNIFVIKIKVVIL